MEEEEKTEEPHEIENKQNSPLRASLAMHLYTRLFFAILFFFMALWTVWNVLFLVGYLLMNLLTLFRNKMHFFRLKYYFVNFKRSFVASIGSLVALISPGLGITLIMAYLFVDAQRGKKGTFEGYIHTNLNQFSKFF